MNLKNKTLLVGNLPFGLKAEDLKEIFSPYGEVSYSKVVMDKETGQSKGYGFVEFVNENDAENAMFDLDGAEVDGKIIKVVTHIKSKHRPKYTFRQT